MKRGQLSGAGIFDLREHFGIWDRCGNTRFFKKQNPWSEIYLNPLDGVLLVARDETKVPPTPQGAARYTLVVKGAAKAQEGEVKKAFETNPPWVARAVTQFFYSKALGWALDAIKEHAGRASIPGDRELGNFLRYYKSGAGDREKYLQEGGSGKLEEPFLEETLEAIYRAMNSMTGITVDYGRNLSRADLDEALSDRGILECV